MESQAKEQNQKNDWKKKGLGWVPDYPDLRDYDLTDEEVKNKLRLKTDEKTDNIEQLLDLIIANLNEETRETGRIDEIKNKILGNVVFTKIKVHKVFRDEVSKKDSKYIINKINYESILSKQILELKKCLAFLVLKKYLLGVEQLSEQSEEDDLVDFHNPAEVVAWMKEDRYDKTTQELVKQFQLASNINDAHGIVTLDTYTNLNEYFSNPKKLLSLKKCKINESTEQKSTSESRFFSVTSLIPSVAFNKILDIFQLKAAEQVLKEIKELPRQESNHLLLNFEQEFLTQIHEPRDFFEKLFKEIPNDVRPEKITDYNDLKYLVNNLLIEFQKENNKCILQVSDILEVLQNSYLFEPIVSVIINSLCPLAKCRNQSFEDFLENGFDKFEEIIHQKISSETKTNLGYSQKQLAKDAIIKVVYYLKLKIHSLVEEEKNLNQDEQNAKSPEEKKKVLAERKKFISTVLFCLLLKKYLNRFTDCIIDAEHAASGEDIKSNIFDKQEVFEIENLVDDKKQDSTKPEKLELFPTLQLYIPLVSNSVIKELKRRNKEGNSSEKIFFLLPGVVDLSFWCSPVRDQGSLNSCTAFAAIALLEYFANRNYQQKINPSALFLYKAARKKINVTGDVGASIRETMKVLALFGVPPEDSWSYDEDKVDEEPPPYCYAYAQNYKTLKYFLLDYAGISKESLLFQIKAVLAAGFPCIFGFTLYASAYEDSNEPGHIPYPDQKNDKVVGGHTAVVVGYDDFKFMLCADRKHYSQGAFLIRNSWGPEWGVNGYGWIPYDYVLAGLTAAWWSLLKSEWFNEDNFGLAATGSKEGDSETKGSKQP